MASVEALWTIDFDTVSGSKSTGVVVLETNRLFGGDGLYYYLGRYELIGTDITAEVKVTRYLRGPEVVTAWGDDAPVFHIKLKGVVQSPIPRDEIGGGPLPAIIPDGIKGQMHREGFPPLGVRLVKREALP